MDTCFPLLQPKHHCVKVTGERPRETNQSQECGRRAGREASKTRAAGVRERTAAHGQRCGRGRSAVAVAAVKGRTSPGRGGREVLKVILERWLRRGDRVISSPHHTTGVPCRIFRQRDWKILLRRLGVDGGDASPGDNVLHLDSTGLLL